MKPFRKFIILSGFATLLFLVSACASKEARVTGKWIDNKKNASAENYFEFFSDKTASLKLPGMPPFQGTWAILDDGRVKADISGVFGTKMIFLGKVEKGILRLDFNGATSEFKKL